MKPELQLLRERFDSVDILVNPEPVVTKYGFCDNCSILEVADYIILASLLSSHFLLSVTLHRHSGACVRPDTAIKAFNVQLLQYKDNGEKSKDSQVAPIQHWMS